MAKRKILGAIFVQFTSCLPIGKIFQPTFPEFTSCIKFDSCRNLTAAQLHSCKKIPSFSSCWKNLVTQLHTYSKMELRAYSKMEFREHNYELENCGWKNLEKLEKFGI